MIAASGGKFQFLFIAVFAGILCVFASLATYAELRPFLGVGSDREAQYQFYVDGKGQAGHSSFSQDIVLRDCLQMITSIYGRLQSVPRRNAVLAHCRAQAVSITGRSPSHSFAWFTRAVLAAHTGQFGEMNVSLAKSRLVGPNEQWIAEARVKLAEQHLSLLSQTNQLGNDQDLILLIRSSRGVKTIALDYVQRPAFRRRIAALVELQTEEIQHIFVQQVRHSAHELGLL